MTILLTNTSQLSTSLNTLQFSQHTPYSCQLILISYYSSIKLLKSSTQSTSLQYSSQIPYSSQLNQLTLHFSQQTPSALNSFKHLTILITKVLQISNQSNTSLFSCQTP